VVNIDISQRDGRLSAQQEQKNWAGAIRKQGTFEITVARTENVKQSRKGTVSLL
jgi:hypothetical protein